MKKIRSYPDFERLPMITTEKKRNYVFTILLVFLYIGVFYSCNKYKDPAPGNANLTNPYCNDPTAVNYNVGFPGKPDNTKCVYPSDLFKGGYHFHDTIRVVSSGLLVAADSFDINIDRIAGDTTKAKMVISGFCGGGLSLRFTASAAYTASSDTTIGDTLSAHVGQQFCHVYDTLMGAITRDRISDSILYFDFKIYSDTTTYSLQGIAVKK